MEACCWHILIRLFVSLILPLSQAISALLLHEHTQIVRLRHLGERSQLLYPLKRALAQGSSYKTTVPIFQRLNFQCCIWAALIALHKDDGSCDGPGGEDINHLGTNYIAYMIKTIIQHHSF